VVVVASEPSELDLYLTPTAVRLPAMVVEGKRAGIFGTVGDTAYHIADGVRVQLLGPKHLEVLTDSLGKFAFPGAPRGSYIVRVTYQNDTGRRILVELQDGEGREVAVLISPTTERTHMADEAAARDLGLRLAMSVKRQRLTSTDIERTGARSVCDLPQIKTEIGISTTTVILNGRTVYLEMSLQGLCAWRADEVELVEFGKNVCMEQTHTVADVLKLYCGPLRGRGETSLGNSSGLQSRQSYVVIWERK
ncbi:MAG: carboxypeptidase-like regulatory domain-containing protein, partial [bacterium]